MERLTRGLLTALVLALTIIAGRVGSTPSAEAVIEQLYTLPFQGQSYVGTWFCGYSGHEGTDYVLSDTNAGGHPVTAAARGETWLYEQFPSGAGYYVVINHGNGHRTRYLHLSSRVVVNGQQVARGQVIGYEGLTGDDDNHLHFETRHGATTWPHPKNGTAVDPYGTHCTSGVMWKTNPPGTARDLDFSGDGYPDVLGRENGSAGVLCLIKGNGAGGWILSPMILPSRPATIARTLVPPRSIAP